MSFNCARRDLLVVGQVLEPDVLGAERDQDLVQLHVVIDVLLAFLALDLIKRRLSDVNLAGSHQLGHLPKEKSEQERANVRAVDVGVGHDNDPAVAKPGDVETTFVFAVTVFLRLTDAGADRGDHRLDFVVLEELDPSRAFSTLISLPRIGRIA